MNECNFNSVCVWTALRHHLAHGQLAQFKDTPLGVPGCHYSSLEKRRRASRTLSLSTDAGCPGCDLSERAAVYRRYKPITLKSLLMAPNGTDRKGQGGNFLLLLKLVTWL